MRRARTLPPRYVIFAAVCGGWLVAMSVFAESLAVHAAARAWFTNWAFQIAVSITSWICPDVLRTPTAIAKRGRPVARPPGVLVFGAVARRIHPYACGPRTLAGLRDAMMSAEATHLTTAVVVCVLSIVLGLAGSVEIALFLTLWNVLFNVYPIALQRHNLARLRGIAMRQARRRVRG